MCRFCQNARQAVWGILQRRKQALPNKDSQDNPDARWRATYKGMSIKQLMVELVRVRRHLYWEDYRDREAVLLTELAKIMRQ